MVSYFPLISSVISAVFTLLLGVQYIRRRKKHQLVWTIAAALFTLSSTLAFLSETNGWNVFMYQVYYFSVSPMVAFMGVGTLNLLVDKPWGKYFLVYTLILSSVFLVLVFTAEVNTIQLASFSPPSDSPPSDIGSAAMSSNAKMVSPLLSVPGGLVLIGGALYSFWLDKSRKYNLLIALGGITHLLSGLRARFGGDPTYFFILTTIGVFLLFVGFLLSSEYIRKREKK